MRSSREDIVCLFEVDKTNSILRDLMAKHYSHPMGFVGRSIPYLIFCEGVCYGAIVGGSATKHLPGRNSFLGVINLNQVVNNIFFHIEKRNRYPFRNFVPFVIGLWRQVIQRDWKHKYSDEVIGFETLVELPRTGECYRRDGWERIGQTKGFTCKRIAGKGTDSWSGKRVWDTKNLRPKHVFAKKVLCVLEKE